MHLLSANIIFGILAKNHTSPTTEVPFRTLCYQYGWPEWISRCQ